MPGRITFEAEGRALVAGDVALGVGWGSAAVLAITAGSNSQRGAISVTASASTPAQATATIAITFPKAFDNVPFAVVSRAGGTAAVTVFPTVVTCTATVLTIISNTLPVSAEITIFSYFVAP